MNAKPYLSLLAALAVLPFAQAQSEPAPACADCALKDQTIQELKAELQQLQNRQAAAEPATPSETAPSTVAETAETYTVVAGDSLMKIARNTGCNANELANLNGLKMDSVLQLGQKLKLPAGAVPNAPKPAPKPTGKLKTYKIQDGDTYFSLSRRFKIPVNDLIAANPQAKPNQLYAGRTINLPGTAEEAVPAPAEAAAPDAAAAPDKSDTPTEPAGSERKVIAVTVDTEISYGEFATKHGTDIDRLNALNDLNLTSATILAKGSELYVPAQP